MAEGDSLLKEFKAFVLRGNVVDLAVAVVIGAAFGAVAVLAGIVPAALGAPAASPIGSIEQLSANVVGRGVQLRWSTPRFPGGATDAVVVIARDGQVVGQAAPTGPFVDETLAPGG